MRDNRSLLRGIRELLTAAGGGIVSLIAYSIVIYAMSFGAMGVVSGLRETSVVFAALIARVFLHERLSSYRMEGGIMVAVSGIFIRKQA
ncbi:EamA family transporter [Novosphingobium sp. P6W]|uniref:EamA family transporter n=1 Tax=Novosphingobium sp. P6W TaxID=1609758 RepID=UPI0005C2FDA4|nr:EamA family transporter [Novosphingobium sp. P6W]AXB78860.1 hypothetical protein TQ38_019945 [Novosphingobium sp. P6W]KIS30148.1 hypothetical protein TQ38_24300 [Novosphingobium sp. P6W]